MMAFIDAQRAEGHAVESISIYGSRVHRAASRSRHSGSIGTVGDALDNALMESTIGLYKCELIDLDDRGGTGPGGSKSSETAEWGHWYNHQHRHSRIGLHTPASVHSDTVHEIRAQRGATVDAAYAANPDRFRHRRPQPPALPTAAWINQPEREALIHNNERDLVSTHLTGSARW